MKLSTTPDIEKINRIFVRRVLIAGAFVFSGLGALIARYGYLQLYNHDQFQSQSDNNRTQLISAPPSRGRIFDRNGLVLADNIPGFTAMIQPNLVENPKQTLELLAPIFDLTKEDITAILARIEKDKDDPKSDPVMIKMDLNETQVAQFSERKPFFKGVRIQSKLTRMYHYDELFAHVIGYVGRINDKETKTINSDPRTKNLYAGTDVIGKLGIEKYYEELLMGKPGFTSIETNAHGDVLRKLDSQPPIVGNDINLTIDYGLQKVCQRLLRRQRGAIVAIDPRNGDVLAFYSNPTYDPNPFISGIPYRDYNDLRDDPDKPLYNRALQGMYPPASTVKPFEAMGVLHYGLMNWGDTIFDPGYFSLPNHPHKFRDWNRNGHGTVNMKKSIVWSVDTYYYKQSYRMGIDRLAEWMKKYNFGKKTGIDLAGEKTGVMPNKKWKMDTYNKKWKLGDTISASIGQGYFLATPLQVANATAMTAAKGKHLTPHLLKSSEGEVKVTPITAPDGEIEFNGTSRDWDRMHNAMESTVRYGTAKKVFTSEYRMAGKTGTAQVKSIPQGKRYNKYNLKRKHWDHAWFIGFAPVENPEIALAVLVENGGSGGKVAAPMGRKVFDYWLHGRHSDPVLPPTPKQLVKIKKQKAEAKKRRDAKRDIEDKAKAKAEGKRLIIQEKTRLKKFNQLKKQSNAEQQRLKEQRDKAREKERQRLLKEAEKKAKKEKKERERLEKERIKREKREQEQKKKQASQNDAE